MTELTRRRIAEETLETWDIFHGDLPVGTIAKLEHPSKGQVWRWDCGIYLECT
jgi:hypothetical protein